MMAMLAAADTKNFVDATHSLGLHRQPPTIFHITHWKAGSQWIHRIFHGIAYHRLVLPDVEQSQFFERPIQTGKIYPTIYASRQAFHSVQLPSDHRRFVIIRDLRDTLVSLAFSLLYSHSEEASIPGFIAEFRSQFLNRPIQDVLIHMIDSQLTESAKIQMSWLGHGEVVLRYEDLLRSDIELLTNTLIHHCQLDIPPTELVTIVMANRFEQITGGRHRGQENILAHERKGIAGDWRNYFSDQVTRAFKDRFADVLVATGYETDSDW